MKPRPRKREGNGDLNVTVIGGGTGLPIVLSSLKAAGCKVTAVVTVADDGGSSGGIRESINTIPPGDIRNCFVALSDLDQIYLDIFQYRFAPDDKEFSGHSIGNLIIAALTEMAGDTSTALRVLSRMMKLRGRVLPASDEPLVLQAWFKDGTFMEGETNIVAQRKPIDHVGVRLANLKDGQDPQPHAARGVVKAIRSADLVVLGPGSLYTSILPNLVIDDIRQAVLETEAPVAYICNIMTQVGETEHYSDADHVRALNQHLGAKGIDVAIVNKTPVPQSYIDSNDNPELLVQVTSDPEGMREEAHYVMASDLMDLKESGIYHDKRKLVHAILEMYDTLAEGDADDEGNLRHPPVEEEDDVKIFKGLTRSNEDRAPASGIDLDRIRQGKDK